MSRAQLTSTVEQNSAGAASPFLAGKNKVINGDFGIWQRGTTFNSVAVNSYTADRFYVAWDSGPTVNVTQQTFTPGTAPVAGYESAYFFRLAETATSSSTVADVRYRIEDVRTFAGQTATLSWYAKADSARTMTIPAINQDFGTGGSAAVALTPTTSSFNLTTSWQRFSTTVTFPSIAGKTIGTNSVVSFFLRNAASSSLVFDLWGVQFEAGPVATPFTTASGTLQGELALCQRYYIRKSAVGAYQSPMIGSTATTTAIQTFDFLPVPMRVVPTSVDFGGSWQLIGMSANISPTLTNGTAGINTFRSIPTVISLDITCSSTTSFVVGYLRASNDTTAYFGYSAEL